MANSNSAWGIEIGAYALKAIRLEREGDEVQVTDFAVIPHKKVLTTPDTDRDELVRLALGQFTSQRELEHERMIMSVPGHAAFARFAKLPPVEPKKVPDIVRFEAVQQIPFAIEEVEWDYQTFTSDDSPEVEVGIFAITRERVQQRLSLYGELGVTPDALTLSPLSVFNAMNYDLAGSKTDGPVVYLDIGTQATDVIVVHEGTCWVRTFPLGGTHFTEAIAESFKLSYSKAEKLKYEAATSKYAKQIMQAMRPVFSDLLQEVQRSIGYYQSMHKGAELETMIGLGSTFKIPGLRKFLGQQLQMQVQRLDEYKRISVTGREAASFAESAVNMATAYGLALQGVGLASIDANLVPVPMLREQLWRGKTKWFAAAAGLAIAAGAVTFYQPLTQSRHLNQGGLPPQVQRTISMGNELQGELTTLQEEGDIGYMAENMVRLADYRWVWGHLMHDISQALHSPGPQPELLSADLDEIMSIDPEERRFIQLRNLQSEYRYNEEGDTRRIAVTMNLELTHRDAIAFLNETVEDWLRDHAERDHVPYRIVDGSVRTVVSDLERHEVTDDGELEGRGDGGTGEGRGRSPGDRRPAQGGGGGGEDGGGGGAMSGSRGGDPGLAAPGSGGGGEDGAGRGAGRDSGGRSGWRGATGRPTGDDRDALEALDEMAPLPDRPSIYPPGAEVVHVPVRFEVELLEPMRLRDEPEAADVAAGQGRTTPGDPS